MKKFTILIAAVALVCFSVPAMAVDWNFYGSARMATFYISDDLGDGETFDGSGTSEDAGIQWDLQSNSRFGANVKAENIKGQVELALKGTGSGDADVGTRRIYGVWNFGSGYMKVGKDYTPVRSLTVTSVCWVPVPSTATGSARSPSVSVVSRSPLRPSITVMYRKKSLSVA